MQPSLSTSPLKVLIFGAGAIGTYVGGSLALAGHNVVFMARPAAAEELRQRGLRLDLSLDERRSTKEINIIQPRAFSVESSLEDAMNHWPFDVAIFALKSYDMPDALKEMRPFADKLPPVLCLSNGVDNEPALASVLGEAKVIAGTITTAVSKRAPGDIALEKLRGLGIANGHALSAKLIEVFNAAWLNAQLFENPAAMKWSKMLTNLLANPTSAILDMTAAQIFAERRLYKLEIAMLSECLAVMEAQGIPVVDVPATPVRALAFATKLPLWLSRPLVSRSVGRGRGNKMPSFHIDLYSGRGKSEVDYLHGAIVRAGRKVGVTTPVNSLLTETLLALTNKEIPRDMFAGKPEKLLSRLNIQF